MRRRLEGPEGHEAHVVRNVDRGDCEAKRNAALAMVGGDGTITNAALPMAGGDGSVNVNVSVSVSVNVSVNVT